jgi:PKD repeat protein
MRILKMKINLIKFIKIILLIACFSCLFSNYALAESVSITISGPGKCLVNEELSFSVDVKEEWIIESADWEFGDGTSSERTSVSHKFSNAGEFSVKVTVDAYKKVINDEGSTEKKTGSGSATKKVTCMGKISISADPKELSADGESTSTISVSTLDVSGNPFNCKRDIELSVSESDSNNNDNELPSLPNLPSFPRKLGEAGANGNASSSSDILSLSSLEMENGSGTATATAGTKAGTAKIKAAGSYLSSASCTIKVEESKKLKLSISASPDILPADGKSQTTLSIKVVDAEGHIDTTYNGSVSLQSSNVSALKVPNSVSIKEGKGTAKATAGSSAADVPVKVSDSGLIATSCKVTVFKVTLSVDKMYIAAESDWTGIDNDLQEVLIAVNIIPKAAKDKVIDKLILKITDITDGAGYDSGKGKLAKKSDGNARWLYIAFEEPKSENRPLQKRIHIAAGYNGKQCSDAVNFNVKPVFYYLADVEGNHNLAWQYSKFKYNINVNNLKSISYSGSSNYNGSTTISKNCYLGRDAFDTENKCASVLGHENVHGKQPWWYFTIFCERALAEAEPYEWQYNNIKRVGLDNRYGNNAQYLRLVIEAYFKYKSYL